MSKIHYSALGIIVLILLTLLSCAPKPFEGISSDATMTCIQGKVSYKNPIDASLTPYPGATISSWDQTADKALSEARTNQMGDYCIEVPVADFKIDLRVWGSVFLQGTTYLCQGSAEDIDQGKHAASCGDCKVVDIVATCKERVQNTR
jgi:hypothetical protein